MTICELCPCDLADHYDGVYCMVPACSCTADRETLDAYYKGHDCGAAVAFGLLGMADAIRNWTWAGVLP